MLFFGTLLVASALTLATQANPVKRDTPATVQLVGYSNAFCGELLGIGEVFNTTVPASGGCTNLPAAATSVMQLTPNTNAQGDIFTCNVTPDLCSEVAIGEGNGHPTSAGECTTYDADNQPILAVICFEGIPISGA